VTVTLKGEGEGGGADPTDFNDSTNYLVIQLTSDQRLMTVAESSHEFQN
jgi:hypothetical protein